MKRGSLLLTLVIAITASIPAFGQTEHEPKQTPESKLIEFHMALLKHGPKWVDPHAVADSAPPPIFQQHVAYVTSLLQSGKVVIAGPIQDDPELSGIYIFRAKSADEARSWAMADPAVAAGQFKVEMHPWWSEDVMKKPSMPIKLTTAYLAFLVRGE